MREWYLSAELINLDTMPNSIAGISQKAKRKDWISRKAKGGGRSLEYHISNFETEVQSQLLGKENKNIKDDKLNPYEFISIMNKNSEVNKKHTNSKNTENISLSIEVDQKENVRYIELDFYKIVAGRNLTLEKNATVDICFTESFIQKKIRVDPKHLFLMSVTNDSMYPTLKNDSIIMIRRTQNFIDDGVYIFQLNTQVMVKRLQLIKSDFNVISDNSSYKPWILTKEDLKDEDLVIIGRVVWSEQCI